MAKNTLTLKPNRSGRLEKLLLPFGELARTPGFRSGTHWSVIRAPSRTGWVEASPEGRHIHLQPDLGHRNGPVPVSLTSSIRTKVDVNLSKRSRLE